MKFVFYLVKSIISKLRQFKNEYSSLNNRQNCTTNCTKVGKHSPQWNHWLIESIGAFCSIAEGVDVVANHPLEYVSTHAFLFADASVNFFLQDYLHNKPHYEDNAGCYWYLNGVKPKGVVKKSKKITIGNEVWLGRNVTICNGACIGNGAVCAAGAVVISDVPDYAIVGGVPAHVIGYRCSEEQIKKLNAIKWWDWSDELIAERYDDFFIPIEDFCEKYY